MQALSKNPYDLIDAFLFDLDGTLTDTLPGLKGVYYAFLKDFGKSGSDAEFASCNGLRISEVVEKLKATHGLSDSLQKLLEIYNQKLGVLAAEPAQLTTGTRELLEYLRSIGIRLGVVTSATTSYAQKILSSLNVDSYFSVVVGSDSVKMGKPHPEPYLTALKKLHANPERALALEDSPKGISAAAKARIKCIGICGQQYDNHLLYASGAFETVQSMSQIKPIVERFRHVRPSVYAATTLAIVEEGVKDTQASELDKKVELYWGALKQAHDHLFDGSAIFLKSTEKSQKHLRINVGSCSYRYIVAGCRGMVTGMEGLAVTGIVVTDVANPEERRYLIGKRSETVLQHPGCWEFIPSGAIDQDARRGGRLDPEEQLIRELQEEVSLESKDIVTIEFLGLIRDINYKVADLCYMIKIKPHILSSLKTQSAEYTQIKTVDIKELQAMIHDTTVDRVPTTQALIAWSHDRLLR